MRCEWKIWLFLAVSSAQNIVLRINNDLAFYGVQVYAEQEIEPVIYYTVYTDNQLNVTVKHNGKVYKVNTM